MRAVKSEYETQRLHSGGNLGCAGNYSRSRHNPLCCFSRVRENGRRTSCASNLKQLGMALMQYAQDYDERFPNVLLEAGGINRAGGWVFYSAYDSTGFNSRFDVKRGSLFPYSRSSQIYVCPSDVTGRRTGNSHTLNHVAWNTCEFPYCFGRLLSDVKNASTNILAMAGQETPGASTDDGAGIGCNLEGEGTCNTGT